jgi:hypothetical protein
MFFYSSISLAMLFTDLSMLRTSLPNASMAFNGFFLPKHLSEVKG